MDISWENSVFALLSANLSPAHELEWQPAPPPGWIKERDYVPHEETLQTLLSLHLAEVCGERVRLVGKAGEAWGVADLVGFDMLGRVHLFELKRGTIDQQAARQLSYYLLRQVFVDPARFVEQWWKRMGEFELQDWKLAETIAGTLAGQRTDNIGPSFVHEMAGAPRLSKQEWKPMDDDKKHRLKLAALLSKARGRLEGVPTREAILECARAWRSRLWPDATPPSARFECETPVVIWLVGARFTREAKDEIRRWRSAGTDARCLQAEVRFSSRRDGLILRVAREVAPGRAELARRLEAWAADQADSTKPRLMMHLYTVAQPSATARSKEAAGLPLKRPTATITLDTGKSLKLPATGG